MGNEKICKNCKNWDETFTRTSKKHPFGYCNGVLVVNAEPPAPHHTRKGKIYIGWGKLAELGDDFIIQFRDDFSCEYFKTRSK